MASVADLSVAKEKYLKKLKQKKYRKVYGFFVCEGIRTFKAALKIKDISIAEVVIDKKNAADFDIDELKNTGQLKDARFYLCSEKTMRRISDDVSPPGILFTCKSPLYQKNSLDHLSGQYMIYLDRIADPGNLGTIIRTAVWFGLTDIILSPDSADPLSPKTIRSTAGAIFHAKIMTDIVSDRLTDFARKKDYLLISAVPRGGEPVDDWIPAEKCIICLGSEAHGLTPGLLKMTHKQISIPGSDGTDSLNIAIATGIILYRLNRFKKLKY